MTRFPTMIPSIWDDKAGDSSVSLHLEQNQISDLYTAVKHFYTQNATAYSRIKELYLSYNEISTVNHTLLPGSLSLLYLDHNYIKHLNRQENYDYI